MSENKIFVCKKCGENVSPKIYLVDSLCADCNIKKHEEFLNQQTFKYIKISEKKEKFYIEKV